MTRRHGLPLALRSLLISFLLLAPVPCLLTAAVAQSATATLSGTVEDQNGAVVPGVNVSVQNTATSAERQATTNDSGYFTVPLLPPGTYTITARRDGFTPLEIRNVTLNVGDQKALQIQLKAGDINATVQVISDAPLINESPAVATVVDRQFVANIPLNGRSFHSLIALSPGVVLTKSTFSEQGQFSVNGQRADANYFTVDGVSANISVSAGSNLGQSGAGSLPGLSAAGGTSNLVSVDALQEFKIQTSSYAPEFGRTPGAQVQILTRSGTNEFHGTLFEYFRNDALDASNWFINSQGLSKPALRQNDFGGTFSGPVLLPRFGEGGEQPGYNGRNRTFFFLSYEGLRLRLPQVATKEVPSVVSRQRAAAQIRPLLNGYPLPNGPDTANGFALFSASYSDPSSLSATSIRVDHTVNSNLTLFGRANYAPSENVRRGVDFSLNTLNRTIFNTQTFTTGATWLLTSKISNDFRFNWSRNKGATAFQLDNFDGAVVPPDSLLFPAPLLPERDQAQVFIGSPYRVANKAVHNIQRQINLVDNLSIVSGFHQLKMGFDYRRLMPINEQFGLAANTLFFSMPEAISGVASLFVIDAFAGGPGFPEFSNTSLYAQDTWKATSRLTLTYGLRWEVNPPPNEKNGNLPFAAIGLDNPATIALAPRGTPLYKTAYNNFAPRVGVAYELSQAKGRETVIRGGFGIFYDLGNGQIADSFGFFWPYLASQIWSNVQVPLTFVPAIPTANLNPPFPRILVVDPRLKLPYTNEWNFAIEQSLGANQTVSASYVGAAGRRLLRQEAFTKPNPNFSSNVFVTRNSATSDYHAMQLEFRRRLSRGLQALASYTWSHSIDIASSDSFLNVPVTTIDPNIDRGPSDFDVRHAFNAAVTYSVPSLNAGSVGNVLLRNWSIDTLFNARSATPINVVTGTRLFGVLSVSRPDLISGVPLYLYDRTFAGGKRINRAAFAIPTSARQGTLGRNALRGFPLWQVDMGFRRQFNLTERLNLQFRAEFFNLFNHPNFADPINNLNSGLFGQSTQMLGQSLGSGGLNGGFNPLYQVGGPRSIQFSFRVSF